MSHDANTTNNNNTTISELNLKSKKIKQQKQKVKDADAVEESSPPVGGKGYTKGKDPSSDEKFVRTGSADDTKKPTKGKG